MPSGFSAISIPIVVSSLCASPLVTTTLMLCLPILSNVILTLTSSFGAAEPVASTFVPSEIL